MVKNGKCLSLLALWGCLTFLGALHAQNLNLTAKEGFLDIVEPIMTKGEREIYRTLPDFDSQKYFQAIFWYKRDPNPETVANRFRREFFERRQIANLQFGEKGLAGVKTPRGRLFLLLGEPEDVTQKRLPTSGLRPSYEEVWSYSQPNRKFFFRLDGGQTGYRLLNQEKWERTFENIRNAQVLDRAEPFRSSPFNLTLPNLGFTKDIENLASEDRMDLSYTLSYSFFKGDLNRTEVMAGLTFKDASNRGLIVQLTAFDPYENKVVDFKKRIEPKNGRFESFYVALEPDQYQIVLRLTDKDGREAISRRIVDVPRIGVFEPSASSLLATDMLQPVPLQGFHQPKKFVFGSKFFPIRNDFTHFNGDRVFLMQHFYEFEYQPEIFWYINHRPVKARIEKVIREDSHWRIVVSLPMNPKESGGRMIKSVFMDESGSYVTSTLSLNLENQIETDILLEQSARSDSFQIIHPASDDITALDRVVIKPNAELHINRMFVFLNDTLIAETYRTPWAIHLNPNWFSISGKNSLTVVLETNRGLLRREKHFLPLQTDEKIKTRLVQVFFNAYDANLNFKNDIDFSQLEVSVDGSRQTPKDIQKLDEPITYCFLIDTSYSMKDSFANNISAVKKFVEALRPQDRGYVIGFDNDYVQYQQPNQSKAVLLAAIESLRLQKPNPKYSDKLYQENETYLYDAVIACIHTLLQYSGRKVILLVTDGIGTEGEYSKNGMLSYARENDVVTYSLWLDNNPKLSDDETAFLQKERGKGEKFVRAIGLSRLFGKKDARKGYIAQKIRNASITEGVMQILSEESGGFHYRIFKADRTLIRDYVSDIEAAVASQFMLSLNLPISQKRQHIEITTKDPSLEIRCKSEVKVRKTNPLTE